MTVADAGIGIPAPFGWPSPKLTELTLIDTPGLASAAENSSERTTAALLDDWGDGPGAADAVPYLMRHLHRSDAPPDQLRGAALDGVERRRSRASNPLSDRRTIEAAEIVSRAYEALYTTAGRDLPA